MLRINNPIYSATLLFLFGYVFLSDFIIAMLGFSHIKLVFALGTLLCGATYCVIYYKNLILKKFLWLPLIFVFLYIFIFRSTASISYFYTAVFAFLLIQKPLKTIKLLDIVFLLQFLLILYEFFSQELLYTSVTSGLFNVRDIEQNIKIFEESGFRPKGMYTGVLEATSFVITYSFINRNNFKKVFFSFLMAIILNGRMAMIMTSFILFYNMYLYGQKIHIYKKVMKLSIFLIVAIGVIALTELRSSSLRVNHLFSVINPTSNSFKGRILGYTLAYEHYFNEYSLPQKLFGSTYELIGTNNTFSAAESDVLGMLLEIGLVGFLFIVFNILYAWRKSNDKLFENTYVSIKLILTLVLICLIQYRYLSGNIRGMTFWFLILLNEIDYALIQKPKIKKVRA